MNIKLNKIAQLCQQRNLNKWGFTEDHPWDGAKERELIMLIKSAEQEGIKPTSHKEWNSILQSDCTIIKNDTEYGTDINNNAPHSRGNTPLEALKNAWAVWSIPPLLIMNSEYYVEGISISDVL